MLEELHKTSLNCDKKSEEGMPFIQANKANPE